MNPWGAIIAALIAGFIAFIGMVITKELRSHVARLFYLYGFIRTDSELSSKERKEKITKSMR